MKHDIPLLKSDLDFKWLSDLRLLPCTGLCRSTCLMGREIAIFWNNRYMFLNNFFINTFICKKLFVSQAIHGCHLVSINVFQLTEKNA